MRADPSEKQLLSVPEAARIIGVGAEQVRCWIHMRNGLPTVTVGSGKYRKVIKAEIPNFLRRMSYETGNRDERESLPGFLLHETVSRTQRQ